MIPRQQHPYTEENQRQLHTCLHRIDRPERPSPSDDDAGAAPGTRQARAGRKNNPTPRTFHAAAGAGQDRFMLVERPSSWARDHRGDACVAPTRIIVSQTSTSHGGPVPGHASLVRPARGGSRPQPVTNFILDCYRAPGRAAAPPGGYPSRRQSDTFGSCASRSSMRLSCSMSRTSTVMRMSTMWAGASVRDSNRDDVHRVIRHHCGHVPQQTLAVVCLDRDLHRIALLHPAAPRHVDEARPLRACEIEHVTAVRAVNAYAASSRDVAHDRIVGQRLAALGHLREQISNSADTYITGAFPAPLRKLRRGRRGRRQIRLKRPGELGDAHVSAPERREKILEPRGIEPLRQRLARRLPDPEPFHLPIPDLLPVGDIALAILVLEPVPHPSHVNARCRGNRGSD